MTFAQRAKKIMEKESDPKLQMDLLEQLAKEQEDYKVSNGLDNVQNKFENGGEISLENNPYTAMFYQNYIDLDPLDPYSSAFNPDFDLAEQEALEEESNYNSANKIADRIGRNARWLDDIGNGRFTELTGYDGNRPKYDYEGNILGKQVFEQKSSIGSNINNWMSDHPMAANAASFGIQALPSIASGIISSYTNNKLMDKANKYADEAKNNYATAKAYLQTPQQISLESERSGLRSEANNMKSAGFNSIKNSARTRGEYMNSSSSLISKIQDNLNKSLGSSYQNEAIINAQEKSRVNAENSRTLNATSQFNAGQKANALNNYYNWKQQAMAYQQGKAASWQGAMSDLMKIQAQNQMISSLGNRYGYTVDNWWTPNKRSIKYRR